VISGQTGDVRQIPKTAGFRFTGVVSRKRVSPADAILVARMKVPRGLRASGGLERYMVHFCGATPDYFTEVVFGRDRDGRRGWSFLAGSQFGHNTDYTPTPVGEWDPSEYQLVKIDYDVSRQVSSAHVWSRPGRAWRSIGTPQKVFLSSVQVELKVNLPQDGIKIEAMFDDCRLYPRPETAPVRILVYKYPHPGFVFPGATVTVRHQGETLGSCVTDGDGICSIRLPSHLTYPIDGRIHLSMEREDFGWAVIPSSGVQGLYPGDLWVINAPARVKGSYAGRN
jgi:hypothetical protein